MAALGAHSIRSSEGSSSSRRDISFSPSKSSSIEGRSQCPSKVHDFDLSSLPIRRRDFNRPGYTLPPAAQALYEDLEEIFVFGDKVVPSSFALQAGLVKEKIRSHMYGEWDTGPGCWSADVVAHSIQHILLRACDCGSQDLPEAAWNSEVHSRVLMLALHGQFKEKGIWYVDVTTAQIHDRTLLPTTADSLKMRSRMVDHALVLEPDAVLDRRIRSLLSKHPDLVSINHTNAPYLRYRPIAVSIETKPAAIDEEKANAQICLWLCAQFTLLQTFIPAGASIPYMVVLMVMGHDWKLMIASYNSEMKEIVLLRYLTIGSTSSILGICKLVAALRRIALYVDEIYRPWFEEAVLAHNE